MEEEIKITSKVLVHEVDDTHMGILKNFFQENNLIGLKAEKFENLIETLKSNIDLGAIILCEEKNIDEIDGVKIAQEIHKMRQELPIFLHRKNNASLDDLPQNVRNIFAGAYSGNDTNELKKIIDTYLFNTFYPSRFIRGIEELSIDTFKAMFKGTEISCSTPYLVKDRIIYGELFSLMAIEGSWCRGYMMLQTSEKSTLDLIKSGKTALFPDQADFRSINSLMGEITNMIWGSFKTRFFPSSEVQKEIMRTQVPIIINHEHKYITFGSENPQLCFHYTLKCANQTLEPISLYQRFVFHLGWSPDEFMESPDVVEDLVEAGEIELF